MLKKKSPKNNLYDRWSIPGKLMLSPKIRLSEFIYNMQDLMRMGHYEKVFNSTELRINRLSKTDGNEYKIAFVKLLLGIAQRKCNKLRFARKNIISAYKVFVSVGDEENSIRCLVAVGDTWRAQALTSSNPKIIEKGWRKAQNYYDKSLLLFKHFYKKNITKPNKEITSLKIQILWAQARVLLVLGRDFQIVESNLYEAWELSLGIKSIWAQEEIAQLLGRFYEKTLNYDKSEYWYLIAFKKATESSNVDRLIEACMYLAKFNNQKKDFVTAYNYVKLAEKTLKPLLLQKIQKNHQFYKFNREIVYLKNLLAISIVNHN